MATTNITADLHQQAAAPTTAALLISLPSLDPEAFTQILQNLAEAFPSQSLIVATPDASATSTTDGIHIANYTLAAPSTTPWTLTATDFLNAHELAQQHSAKAILQLGAEAQSLAPSTLRGLANAVLNQRIDLAVPHYDLPPRSGLVNSAIFYPITRALFGARSRFPLAIDLGLSSRALERLAIASQRFTAANQPDALVWPVNEASVAACTIAEVEAGPRTLPQPAAQDLNSLLALVAGSLFADVDAKAAYWQRARLAQPSRLAPHAIPAADPVTPAEATPMIESFRLAYGNLQEIWSLVLPPQSLLGLKRLSVLPPEAFVLPDSLWARIVYDFLLAYRLRTINRGHLLGALTPLYLAWVASHILQTSAGLDPERHVEAVAAAFEADKPYLVSRWRWPDRFNP
jgi:glucosylglycerate synthase